MCRPARPAICAISAERSARKLRPSNFLRLVKATVVEAKVEPHADGVGGHQIVDLAGLEHGDLGVAVCAG